MDLYGYGPIMKASGFSYLCYMFVFKNYKVPILYFILYGFGSLLAANHLSNIKQQNGALVDIGIYEQYYNFGMCLLMIIYMLIKQDK